MNISGSSSIFSTNYIPSVYGGTSYLLDTYSAAAAYSFRKLKTGVTSVVRVRRSGDSAECDFTADEVTDGTLTSWVTAGGGTENGGIVKMYDQSGNSNDLVQTTATGQYSIVISGVLVTNSLGYPHLSTNSISVYLDLTNTIAEVDEYTVCGVYERQTAGSREHWGMANSASECTLVIGTGDAHKYEIGVSSTFSTEDVSGVALGFINRNSSNLVSYYRDGSLRGSLTVTNKSQTYDRISWKNTSAPSSNTTELILFNSDQSANRTAIESDINTYYSIY